MRATTRFERWTTIRVRAETALLVQRWRNLGGYANADAVVRGAAWEALVRLGVEDPLAVDAAESVGVVDRVEALERAVAELTRERLADAGEPVEASVEVAGP